MHETTITNTDNSNSLVSKKTKFLLISPQFREIFSEAIENKMEAFKRKRKRSSEGVLTLDESGTLSEVMHRLDFEYELSDVRSESLKFVIVYNERNRLKIKN